jgi:hypothetical protein
MSLRDSLPSASSLAIIEREGADCLPAITQSVSSNGKMKRGERFQNDTSRRKIKGDVDEMSLFAASLCSSFIKIKRRNERRSKYQRLK